jgi:hypothetical protein
VKPTNVSEELVGFVLRVSPEDGGNRFLRNAGIFLPEYITDATFSNSQIQTSIPETVAKNRTVSTFCTDEL